MSTNNMIHRLELASKTESISKVELLIEEVCKEFSIGEEGYGNILIAVTEAVNNAITHGNQSNENKKVHLAYQSISNEISFTVTDQGNGFDYENVPDPTLPENILKENGRGVFLMKCLADEIAFEDKGKSINLKFRLTGS